jgi:hypothetical protein
MVNNNSGEGTAPSVSVCKTYVYWENGKKKRGQNQQ